MKKNIEQLVKQLHLRTWIGLGLIAVLLPIVLFALFKPGSSGAEWFDDNWGYRKEIPVTNNTTVETDVYIAFDNSGAGNPYVDTSASGRFQSDCGDIRFTTRDGVVLKYIVNSGCTTSSTDIDVHFDSFPAGAQVIYMYYGNPSAVDGFEAAGFSTAASNYTIGTAGSEETGPGPVAFWKFDEGVSNTCSGGTNDICDSTSNRNDGVFGASTAAPSWQTDDKCVSGSCLLFDGSNDIATVSNTVSGIQTVAFWVKVLSTSTTEELFDLNATDYFTSVSGTVTVTAFGTDTTYVDGVSGATTLSANQWHHVAITTTSGFSGSGITIGEIGGSYGNFFIDEVKFYDYARSAAEIKSDFTRGASSAGSSAVLGAQDTAYLNDGLVGYWPMNEKSGTSVADNSGNGNTGTLTNAQETGTSDASGGSTTTLVDTDGSLSATDDVYIGMVLSVTTGGSCAFTSNDKRIISGYVGSTNTITVDIAFAASLNSCQYTILHQVGGKFGNGITFDGVDDYVTVPYNAAFNTGSEITLSAWFYPDTVTNNDHIISYLTSGGATRYYMHTGSGNDVQVIISIGGSNVTVESINSLSAGQWYHFVATYDGSAVRLFVDGEQVDSVSASGTIDTNNQPLYLGSYYTGTLSDDKTDEVRIYNRALSPPEVRDLYNWSAGPILYYSFDENTGTSIVYDRSGSALNGTMQTMDEEDWVPGKYGSALEFDASRQEVYHADDPLLNFDFDVSFSFFLKTTHSGSNGSIFNKYDPGGAEVGYAAVLLSDGTLYFKLCGGTLSTYRYSVTGSTTVNDGKWHHIGLSWARGSAPKIYIDGVADTVSTGSTIHTLTLGNTDNFRIDDYPHSTVGVSFPETVDELKLYNYARTQAEMIEDMNGGHPLGGSPINSQAVHWKLDEMNSSTAYDAAYSTASNGTITGATWTTGTSCKINSCLTFDASGEVVTVATASDTEVDYNGSEPFSGSAWVYVTTMPTSTGSDKDAIIAKWDDTNNQANYRLYVENDDTDTTGNFEVQIYDESASQAITATGPTDKVSQNTWYHVAFTFNGGAAGAAGDLNLYVDGQYKAQNSTNASFLGLENLASDFTVGEYDTNDATAANTAFTGRIDEVKMYSGILSADEVMIDYNAGASVNFATKQIESSDLTDGWTAPVGYWPMDENTGTSTTYDKSGNGNNGTLNSITNESWASGKYGSALNFDGSADYVDIGTGPSSVKSVSFWVYPTTTTEYFVNLTADTDYIAASGGTLTPTGFTSPTVYVNGTNQGATGTIVAGQWQHIVVTSATAENASNFDIGRTQDANYLEGKIDEVKLFSNTLTPAQVAYEYNRGAPVGWWKLDECQGAIAYDSSGNGNNGTITPGAGTDPDNNSVGICGSGNGDEMWNDGTTGKINGSLGFDGSDDYVNVGNVHYFSGEMSIAAWIKPAGAQNNFAKIIARRNSANTGYTYALGYDDSGHIRFEVDDAVRAANTTGTYTSQQWYHVVGTVNNSDLKIYVNGVDTGASDTTGTISIDDSIYNTLIGARVSPPASYTHYFTGLIDDVRLYNYALSAAQVKKIMKDGATGSGVRFGPNTGNP